MFWCSPYKAVRREYSTHYSSGILRELTADTSPKMFLAVGSQLGRPDLVRATVRDARYILAPLCRLGKKKPRPLLALSIPPDAGLSRRGGHGDAPPPATRAPASLPSSPSPSPSPPMWWPGGRAPVAPPDRRASLRHDGGLRLRRSAARATCRRPSSATAWRQQGSPSRAIRWLCNTRF